jgi:hypothetical protein
MSDESSLDIFLSHSSRDSELAKALVDLFRCAINIPASRIRCTSVSGFKLDVGADTNEQLRKEAVEARALVGLLTDVSIDSAYVLFELGARWGAKKYLAPLLGAGRGAEILAGPLTGLNALSCTREDLFQLVSNVATQLGLSVERPDTYSALVDHVVEVSSELAAQRGLEDAAVSNSHTHESGKRSASLTDFQCKYLMTVSRPRNEGFIYSGIDEHKGREVAEYQEALERFQDLTLMAYNGEGYRLTTNGWKLADQLWQLKILDALTYGEVDNDRLIIESVELTDGDAEKQELHRHLSEMERRRFVRITKSSGGWHIQLTEAGLTHRKHRPLSL